MSAAVDTLYTVKLGDTLSKIAKAFYGDGSLYVKIAEANGLNPNMILPVGSRLRIPSTGGPAEIVADGVTQEGDGPIEVRTSATRIQTANVDMLKDWRFWAALGGVALLVWYFTKSNR